MSYAEAARVFAHLIRAGSFFGIHLTDQRTLQVYLERCGTTHLEILDRIQGETLSATVNTPIAEAAIEAAFAEKDVPMELAVFFLNWCRAKLP